MAKKKDKKQDKKLEKKIDKKWLKLEDIIQEITNYDYAMGVLGWDANASGAPDLGADARAESISQLAALYYKAITAEKTGKLLDEFNADGRYNDSLGSKSRAAVRNLNRSYDKIKSIPAEEYAEYSKLCSKAENIWVEARRNNDFQLFKPYLGSIIEFNKRFIEYRGGYKNPYDVLLDDYEPGVSVETLDEFFNAIRSEIVPLYKKLKENSKATHKGENIDELFKLSPVSGQRDYCHRLAQLIGYDMERGLIGESAHPFSIGLCRDDARITTAYDQFNPLKAIFSTAHETGHALFEQGVDIGLLSAFNAKYIPYGLHESQSRFYENHIVGSREFFELEWKAMTNYINHKFKKIGPHEAYDASISLTRDTIRIDADELSYPLHIMIRYDIEKALFEGDISVDELPELWNSKTEEYLGIRPESDAKGILQDIHWAGGSFGYFPSYALGSAYAAQFAAVIDREIGIASSVKKGDFFKIKEWLNLNVHSLAGTMDSLDTIERSTGEVFNPKYYIEYLKGKYDGI